MASLITCGSQDGLGLADAPIEWTISPAPVPYPDAVAAMETRVRHIADGAAPELIWLLEHPALYTAGTGAKPHDLLNGDALPVFQSGRGGQFTYHGPGQRVAYVMLDVKRRFGGDVRAFTAALEQWLIFTLAELGVASFVIGGRTGVWTEVNRGPDAGRPAKIAAIGLRIRRGISFHGVSLNIDPDLSHYGGIVPCGLADSLVTSLAALGSKAQLKDVDIALRAAFSAQFGACLIDGDAPAD